jgi:hypothetical protein
MDSIRKVYLIIIFLTLTGLVFYLGFLYGYRQRESEIPAKFQTINSNGFVRTSLSNIEERDIIGADSNLQKKTFGKLYFQVNSNNQTEIEIRIDNSPIKITQPDTGVSINIPDELSVDIAVMAIDQKTGINTYEYINISPFKDRLAKLRFRENENGSRSARFSGILDRPIAGSNLNNIERIVLNPLPDSGIENIFVDTNPDLPLQIRGNSQANIPAKPAPFFWAIL